MEILKLIMKIIKKLLRYTNVIPNPPIEDIVMVDEEKPYSEELQFDTSTEAAQGQDETPPDGSWKDADSA